MTNVMTAEETVRQGRLILKPTEWAILDTLRGMIALYGKKYCFPRQDTLIEKLAEHHGIFICRRTLNYALRRLEDNNLIKRFKRLVGGRQTSTAYYILDRGGFVAGQAVRRVIGVAKRLRALFPAYRVQKLAHNRFLKLHDMPKDEGCGPIFEPHNLKDTLLGIKKRLGF